MSPTIASEFSKDQPPLLLTMSRIPFLKFIMVSIDTSLLLIDAARTVNPLISVERFSEVQPVVRC